MALLYVTEFAFLPFDANGHLLPVAKLAPIAEQTVAVGGTSVASAAFNSATTFIRLASDVICSVAVGATPTATAANMRIPANAPPEYFSVTPGQKIAAITNT